MALVTSKPDEAGRALIERGAGPREIAAAEAKRAERHHNDDLQQQLTHGPSLIGKRRD